MGFRFGTCVAMCLLALTAAAMPSAADFEKARPVVEAAAEGQPAEKVQALSAEAETEAGKYLLLEKAAAASAPSGGAASDHLYLVVDLASGPKARKYRVTYLKSAPPKGWTKEHKTKKLVLRRIEPGTFIMGEDQKNESHRVTLTQPFYIGVFETTQRQWELVMGDNPSEAKGEMRPVEKVSWNKIRGDSKVHDWPAKKTVAPDSFAGRLRARTGLAFDCASSCRGGDYPSYAGNGSGFRLSCSAGSSVK